MKKSLLIAALAAFTMASCSKDQVVETPQEEISFKVVANNATKAADVYCNNNLMENFAVWASYNGESYFAMENVAVAENGACTPDNVRYWPAFDATPAQTMTFYALAGTGQENFDWQDVTSPKLHYVVNKYVATQEDVLFARSADFTSKQTDPVKMNFRHALSLIEFKAKNTSKNLHVVISGVCVSGAKNKGTFTFPTAPTTDNYVDHNDTDGGDNNAYNNGLVWQLEDQVDEYVVTLASEVAVPNAEGNNIKSLTYLDAETEDYGNSMLLMPQETDDQVAGDEIYIGVFCKIYNMNKDVYDPDTDALLASGWAMMPIDVTWQMGNKYIYTFVFGDGNGGTDGGDDPVNPEPGTDPVLFPIEYTVSVDDFDFIEDKEVIMQK